MQHIKYMKHFIFVLSVLFFLPALHGQYQIEYWENQNKRSEGNLVNGKEDSVWTYYYSNGKKQMEGLYQNGKHIGNWKSWYSTGAVWLDLLSETGTFTSWYPDGKLES